jgi:hypothetical protein
MGKNRRVPLADGHDIVVWQKALTSPTWACGYTMPGTSYLKSYNPDYVQGRAMRLEVEPEEFVKGAPLGLTLGGMGPSKKVFTIRAGALH